MSSAAVIFSLIIISAVILNGSAQVVTQPATSPTLDPNYLASAVNASDVSPKNRTTGVVTLTFFRRSPNITGPFNMTLNNFTSLSTIFELRVMPNATTNQTVFVLGQISLLETELAGVEKVLCNMTLANVTATTMSNVTIAAINNHMISETPKLIFVHMSATGPLNQTTTMIQQILNQTTILRPTTTQPTNQTATNQTTTG